PLSPERLATPPLASKDGHNHSLLSALALTLNLQERVQGLCAEPANVPVERQQIDHNGRRKNSQLSAPTGLLDCLAR
ncbi:MAG: hypothetical protein HC833_18970, partial [Leptolyngbyaceae cyanobacterium RM1_406_9]|nr:hypothetical protein [Leptolyngbyaceae cyanobacterium RM1_406_9]